MTRPQRPFRARPRHPLTGRQIVVSASTSRELEALLHRIDTLREDLRLGTATPAEVDRQLRRLAYGPVTLQRAALAYSQRTDVARNTARNVTSFLASAGAPLAPRVLDELDAPTLERWELGLRAAGFARSTISTSWRLLRSIVRYAGARGWIGAAPWGAWRPSRRPTPGSGPGREAARDVGELVAILGAARELDARREAEGDYSDVEPKAACAALLGARQGELAGLRWGDVDAERSLVTIARQWDGAPPKGRRSCTLRAVPELFPIFAEQRARLQRLGLYRDDGPVFPDMRASSRDAPRAYRRGEPLSRRDLRAVVSAANLPHPSRWSANSLRDTFATLESVSSSGDLRALSERTRHASIASLVRYLRSRTREPAPPGFALGVAPPARALPMPRPSDPGPHKEPAGVGGDVGRGIASLPCTPSDSPVPGGPHTR